MRETITDRPWETARAGLSAEARFRRLGITIENEEYELLMRLQELDMITTAELFGSSR